MHPPIEQLINKALDVTAPEYVEIEFDKIRRVLYVNVNGITLFRACQVESLVASFKTSDSHTWKYEEFAQYKIETSPGVGDGHPVPQE